MNKTSWYDLTASTSIVISCMDGTSIELKGTDKLYVTVDSVYIQTELYDVLIPAIQVGRVTFGKRI